MAVLVPDFSVAGLQAGGDEGSGTRSSLMYETIRIVEKLKPKYVLWENVKNLLSKKHKHNFDNYIERLNQLGYNSYYKVLNAKDYNVPQNRERVYTISIRKDIDNGQFEFPKPEELKTKLKDILENEVDEKFYLSDKKIQTISHWKSYKKPFEKVQGRESISPTLTARGAGEEHSGMILVSQNLENTTNLQNELCDKILDKDLVEPYDVINHSYSQRKIQDIEQDKGIRISHNISPTLTTRGDTFGVTIPEISKINTTNVENTSLQHQVANKIIEKGLANEGDVLDLSYANSRLKEIENRTLHKQTDGKQGVYPTLKTDSNYSFVISDKIKILRIRKLTPLETWRLMTFDDEDFYKAQNVGISNSQLYKQAGNSIVVKVLEKIFTNLFLK